jgi:hypothetical protein
VTSYRTPADASVDKLIGWKIRPAVSISQDLSSEPVLSPVDVCDAVTGKTRILAAPGSAWQDAATWAASESFVVVWAPLSCGAPALPASRSGNECGFLTIRPGVTAALCLVQRHREYSNVPHR